MENVLTKILEIFPDSNFLKADGFDNCVIGYDSNDRLIYSVSAIIEQLVKVDNMDMDEAIEHFHFNIESAFMGDNTPIYMYSLLD